jgi:hypothetical protein
MHQGKAAPKLALSFATRRIRLGLAHHGSPSAWTAPTKDHPVLDGRGTPAGSAAEGRRGSIERGKPAKKHRR